MTRTTIGALTLALGLSLAPAALAQSVHLERVPGVFRDLMRTPQVVELPLEGDEEGLLLDLGFNFVFYGQTFTRIGVTTNGYVTVGTAVGPDNDALPSAALPNGVLAPFWDDLDSRPSPDARVLMDRTGEAGARVLTIQWTKYALKADPAARLTFQVLIFEGTNEVLFHYGPMRNGDGSEGTGRASGTSATIGVESPDGSAAVPVSFDQPGVARPGLGYAFLPRAGAPLPEGRRLGDLDGDGRVTILDQSRQVELTSPRYRPASALELVAADVAPLDSHGALWGDGTLRVSDRDLISQVIVERVTLAPYLSDLLPGAVAPLSTLTVIGSGFDVSAAGNNVVVLPRAGGGTLEVAAAAVNATGSRLTLSLPQDARRGLTYVKVGTRRTNERTLSVAGLPAILAIAPAPAVIGETLAIGGLEFPLNTSDVQVTIGGLPATVLTITAGPDTGLGPTRIATVQIPAELTPGSHAVVVATGTRVSEPVTHTFGDLPIVAITSPTADAVITDRFTVTGTVQDADLARYELAWAPAARAADADAWTTFHVGSAPVTTGDLGRFDPTLLRNGYYVLRLRAVDALGLTTEDRVDVSVQGLVKVGHFALTFVDLELDTTGIAIRVLRTYDTRRREHGDFGFGWSLGLSSVDLEENDHDVIVANPVTDRVEYLFDPQQIHPLDPRFFTARFVPADGKERSNLDFETPDDVDPGNHVLAKDTVGNFLWFPEGIPFDPQVYRVTMLDRTVMRVHDEDDLLQILKPDGNTLTITRDGITHSDGVSVRFVRDAQDRLTSMTDSIGGQRRYAYDTAGDLVSATDWDGFTTRFEYAADHFLRDLIDPRGVRVQRNEYDDAGRLVAVVDAAGRRTEFTHDLDARREVTRDRAGNLTIRRYDARGRIVEVTAADGTTEAFTFDGGDRVLTRRDRNGNTSSFTYDAAGNQTSQIDATGATIHYTFDGDGRILSITDADGGVVSYTYDAGGNLRTKTNQEGEVTTWTYDAKGRTVAHTDHLGRTSQWSYHPVTGVVSSRIEPSGRTTLYESDANRRPITATEIVPVAGLPSVRATTRWEYTPSGLVTKLTKPDGGFVATRWGPGGRPVERSDSDGRRTTFHYDDLGQEEARVLADGSVELLEHDAVGNLVALEDSRGRRTCEVSPRGLVTRIVLPDGTALGIGYDPAGYVTSRTDGRGGTWRYELDGVGRRVKEIDPEGGESRLTYDGKGNCLTRTDADGRVTRSEYDGVGRHTKTVFPDGSERRIAVDALGRATSIDDPWGRHASFTYSTDDRSSQVVVPAGTVDITYDPRGRITSATDLNAHTTSYRYDPHSGRRVARTLPLGEEEQFGYSALGRPNALTTFDGETVELEYDAAGHLTYRGLPDGSSTTIDHDANGRRTEARDRRGTTAWAYDAHARLTTRLDPGGEEIGWTYDGGDAVTAIRTPAGTLMQTHDLAGRLASITDVASRTTTFAYTPAGLLREVVRPNGVRTALTYDGGGRLSRLAHSGPSGGIAGYAYEYGADGNRSRVVEDSGRDVTYSYDAMGRLVEEAATVAGVTTRTTYTHDAGGNRTRRLLARSDGTTETVDGAFDANDRLLREEVTDTARTPATYVVTYAYDRGGRTRERLAPDELERYDYDAVGRLVSATVTRGATTQHVEHVYDADGRRAETIRDGVSTRFLLDPVRRFSQVMAELDSTGQVTRWFVYGPAAGPSEQPLIETDVANGVTRYPLTDGQLSVRLVTDAVGAVVDAVDYDAFGRPLADRAASTDVLYTGERRDLTTGLYDLRSRWLDVRTGRFLTRDVFEGAPNDPPTLHPYLYALGNPVNFVDPPGTFGFYIGVVFALASLADQLADIFHDEIQREAIAGRRALQEVTASLYEEPNAEDLIAMDIVRWTQETAFPRLTNPHAAHPGDPPKELAVTSIYGQKVFARAGSDLLLGSARGANGDTRTPEEKLAEDERLYRDGGSGAWGPADTNIAREVRSMLDELANSGLVRDVREGKKQVDANGNQVGNNTVDLQFTVVGTDVHWCVDITASSGAHLTDLGRILRNDRSAIALELSEDATRTDFARALANDGAPEPVEQHFIPPPGGPPTALDTIQYRSLRSEPRYNLAVVGNGISAATGEFVVGRTDMRVPGRGFGWELTRVYRSGAIFPDSSIFPLGHNWTLTYDERVTGIAGTRDALELDALGRVSDSHRVAGTRTNVLRTRPPGVYANLIPQVVGFRYVREDGTEVPTAEPGWVRRDADGTVKFFDGQGWLVRIADRNRNTMELYRDQKRRLRKIRDTVGRTYLYEYEDFTAEGIPAATTHSLLTKVTDVAGAREVVFEYDENLDLVAATSPSGRREEYAYSEGKQHPALNHNMLSITSPREVEAGGDPYVVNRYGGRDVIGADDDDFDKVIEQDLGGERDVTLADGSLTTIEAGGTLALAYSPETLTSRSNTVAVARTTTVTDRRGKTVVYSFNGLGSPLVILDEENHETRHEYNRDGLRVLTRYPGGQREYLLVDDANPSPVSQGNMVGKIVVPAVQGGRAIVTEYAYEPVFNQVARVSETRAFLPITSPPPFGAGTLWLSQLRNAVDFERYSTFTFYDYQESTSAPPTFLSLTAFGVVLDNVPRGFGDLNDDGDEVTDLPDNFHGNPVLTRGRRVRGDDTTPEQVAETRTQFNRYGQPTKVIDPEGNVTSFEYYEAGESMGCLRTLIQDAEDRDDRTSAKPPAQVTTTTTYDAWGHASTITDGLQTVTELRWNADDDLLEQVRDATGKKYRTTFEYDANRQRTETRTHSSGIDGEAADLVQRVAYDTLDQVVEEATLLEERAPPEDSTWLSTRHEYDEGQLLRRTILPERNEIRFDYDDRGLLKSVARGVEGSADESILTYDYWPSRSVRTSTDTEDSDQTLFRYDGFNRLEDVVSPTGAKVHREYDAVGNVVAIQRWGTPTASEPHGNQETFNVLLSQVRLRLDDADRVVEVRESVLDVGGTTLPENVTTEAVTRRTYDRLNRITAEIQPDQQTSTVEYDGLGRPWRSTDQLGNSVEQTFDANGNPTLVQAIERSGLSGPQTFTTTNDFDALNRLTTTTDDLSQSTRLEYDSRDRVLMATDPRGNTLRNFYDRTGRPVRTEHDLRVGGVGAGALDTTPSNPDGRIVSRLVYDRNGRVTDRFDDEGQKTHHVYDAFDRLRETQLADTSVWKFEYDRDGNVRQTTDPNGSTFSQEFDGLNRLVGVTVAPGEGVAPTSSRTLQYDGLSRPTFARDGAVVLTRTYDSRSLRSESRGAHTISYTYDEEGKRRTCGYPGGQDVSYDYDELDRLKSVGHPTGSFETTFYGPGRLKRRLGSDGVEKVFQDPLGSPGFDAIGRPTTLAHLKGAAELLRYRFGYDRSGNRTAETRDHDGALEDRFDYDSANRLVSTRYDAPSGAPATPVVTRGIASELFALDGVGNRVAKTTFLTGASVAQISTYSHSPLHAYLEIAPEGGPVIAPTYDKNGNLLSDGTRTFSYDAFNRMVQATTPEGTTTYTYDALGRRVESRTVPTAGPTVTTSFLFDGIRCVEERTSGGPHDGETRQYVFGLGIDEVVLMSVTGPAGPRTYYLHDDAQGSTVLVTDESGTPVDRIAYDAFGTPTFADPAAHAAIGVPWLFQGLRYDAETGLYHARARQYDPVLGRFLQRDPRGLWGDRTNLGNPYTFAGNNPIMLRDPTGEIVPFIPLVALIILSAVAAEVTESPLLASLSPGHRLAEGVMGIESFTGRELSGGERALAIVDAATAPLAMARGLAVGKALGRTAMAVAAAQRIGDAASLGHTAASFFEDSDEEGYDDEGDPFDNCFLAGTLVAMADGSRKAIEQVRAGDRVKASDPVRGEVVDREVVRTFRNVTDTVVDVTWAPLDRVECMAVSQRGRGERHSVGSSREGGESGEDGEPPSAQTVRCTPGHPWWVESQRRWRLAGDLSVGDLLRLDDGRVGVVVALAVRAEVAKTFNFEVEGLHTYFVAQAQDEGLSAVLVHNNSARGLARALSRFRQDRLIGDTGGRLTRANARLAVAARPGVAQGARARALGRGAQGADVDFIQNASVVFRREVKALESSGHTAFSSGFREAFRQVRSGGFTGPAEIMFQVPHGATAAQIRAAVGRALDYRSGSRLAGLADINVRVVSDKGARLLYGSVGSMR